MYLLPFHYMTIAELIWKLLQLKNVNNFIYFFAWAFLLSVVAQVWVLKLTQEGHILFFVRKYAYKLAESYANKKPLQFTERYQRFEYFLKPVIGCEDCVSGQLALWFYLLVLHGGILYFIPFICLTMFFTQATKTIWKHQ